jgi:hypothetical protein
MPFSGSAADEPDQGQVLRLAGRLSYGQKAGGFLEADHKLGEPSFTHFPDGTAHKNRMQGRESTGG